MDFKALSLCVLLGLYFGISPQTLREAIAQDGPVFVHSSANGVTVYESSALINFAITHASQDGAAASAESVAEAMEIIYREDGYFLVEVAYEVFADRIVFSVFEGWIETVSVEGVDATTAARIAAYFEPVIGVKPLRLAPFERALMLSDDLAGIDVTTEIDYPDGQEGARLRILASKRESLTYLTADNPPREFGDAITARLGHQEFSLLTPGDSLRVELGYSHFSEGGDSDGLLGSAYYQAPVSSDGTYAEGFLSSNLARRGQSGAFEETDIFGFTAGALVGHPLYRDIHSFEYLLAEVRHSEANSETPTQEFDSSASALSLSYLHGWNDDHGLPTRLNLTLTGGIADDKQALSGEEPDDAFWHVRAGVGTSRPLTFIDDRTALRAELWGQYSTSRLPTVEEFYLGEREALRGYSFAEVVGDYGLNSTLEVSHQFAGPAASIDFVTPFVFLDAGYADVTEDAFGNETSTLASAGIGSDLQFTFGMHVRGYMGVPLKDGPFTDRGSPGFYLSVTQVW